MVNVYRIPWPGKDPQRLGRRDLRYIALAVLPNTSGYRTAASDALCCMTRRCTGHSARRQRLPGGKLRIPSMPAP
jgi:hypothetical protein